MRAKQVKDFNKIAYIFDFDDTLVKTNANIYILKRGKITKKITPNELNNYILKKDEEFDFKDFSDPLLILSAKKYKEWPTLLNVYKNKIMYHLNVDIYILTARDNKSKYPILTLLKRNNIIIPENNIITIGDEIRSSQKNRKTIIPKLKYKYLKKLSKYYNKLYFYDDSKDNIQITKNINNLNVKLVD